MKRKNPNAISVSEVAGNGLLDRRALLGRGMFFAGAAAAGVGTSLTAPAPKPLPVDPWSMEPGRRRSRPMACRRNTRARSSAR